MNVYDHPDLIRIAVDCIILGFHEDQLQLLVIKRETDPHKGGWSLMGGQLRGEESLDAAAARVLRTLTGLREVYLEQFMTFGEVDRDERGRIVSVGYYALVDYERATQRLSPDYSAHWVPITEIPGLVFDHNDMVDEALTRLQYRATHEPVVFDLLPERFTLNTLQAAYASIFARRIDAGNFRRRLRKMNYLERLPEKDVTTSRKGSYYYRFNPELFAEAVEAGQVFLLKP